MKHIGSKRTACVIIAATMLPSVSNAKSRLSTLNLAEQTFKTKADTWGQCMMSAAPRFLNSTESAEAIATAILGTCSAEENEVQLSLVPIFGLTSPYSSLQQSIPYAQTSAANKISEMRNGFRNKFISIIVERRAQPSN